jgi:hypothetical protein
MIEFLLRKILLRIASGTSSFPSSRVLTSASEETRRGKLLSIACDLWDLSLNDLARKADVSEITVSRFVSENIELSNDDETRIVLTFDRLTRG